jgi:hypothetical protein
VSKALLAGVFILGVGLGVTVDCRQCYPHKPERFGVS